MNLYFFKFFKFCADLQCVTCVTPKLTHGVFSSHKLRILVTSEPELMVLQLWRPPIVSPLCPTLALVDQIA
jgi:hypothetical protein